MGATSSSQLVCLQGNAFIFSPKYMQVEAGLYQSSTLFLLDATLSTEKSTIVRCKLIRLHKEDFVHRLSSS